MESGKSRWTVLFRPHQEGNPHLLPVQAPRARLGIRIAISDPHMRKPQLDGHGRISSPVS